MERHDDGGTLGTELRRLSDALSRMIREHLSLAREELRTEARQLGRDAGLGLGAVPFSALALLFLHLAAAAALAEPLGLPVAFLVVAAADLAIGSVLLLTAYRRLHRRSALPLSQTQEELRRDQAMFRSLRTGPPELPATAGDRAARLEAPRSPGQSS